MNLLRMKKWERDNTHTRFITWPGQQNYVYICTYMYIHGMGACITVQYITVILMMAVMNVIFADNNTFLGLNLIQGTIQVTLKILK